MKITRNSPELLLLLISAGSAMSFAIWQNLLNNFAIERAAFSGVEIGILQSLREVPGFLAFTIVFVLMLIREQRMAYVSLLLLGFGTLLTGFFPSAVGFYLTTILMSMGFHFWKPFRIPYRCNGSAKKMHPSFLAR